MKILKLYKDITKTFRVSIGDKYTTSVPNPSYGVIRVAEIETTTGEWYEKVLQEVKPAWKPGYLIGETEVGERVLNEAQILCGKKTRCYPIPKKDWEQVRDRQIKKTVLLRDQFIGKVKVGDEITRDVIVPQEYLLGYKLAEVE